MKAGERPRLFQRDRPESGFGRILAGFVEAHAQVESAVFVDGEGECIDYATRGAPFDAELAGAQLLSVTAELAERLRVLGSGALILWTLEADGRDFVVRRVTDDHCAVIALAARGVSAHLLRALSALAEALRREGELAVPRWDLRGEPFQVNVRPSLGFGYAPEAVALGEGALTPVEVLGRWTERGFISADEVVCFRVRCADRELTLAHDRYLDRWHRR